MRTLCWVERASHRRTHRARSPPRSSEIHGHRDRRECAPTRRLPHNHTCNSAWGLRDPEGTPASGRRKLHPAAAAPDLLPALCPLKTRSFTRILFSCIIQSIPFTAHSSRGLRAREPAARAWRQAHLPSAPGLPAAPHAWPLSFLCSMSVLMT